MSTLESRKPSRIRRRGDFQSAYRSGRRISGRWVNVFVLSGVAGEPRFGITVTRRSGGAVQRNRLRRQLREILRAVPPAELLAADYVVHVRPETRECEFGDLRGEVRRLLGLAARAGKGRG